MDSKIVLPVIFSILILGIMGISDAQADSITLSDQTSCEASPFFGTWNSINNTCTVNNVNIDSGDTVTIDFPTFSPVTLRVTGFLNNQGTIENIDNISIEGGTLTNSGIINNQGNCNFLGDVTSTIKNSGTITNTGSCSVILNGNFINSGTLINQDTCQFDLNGTSFNSGIIDIQAGKVSFNGDSTNTGLILSTSSNSNSSLQIEGDFTNEGTITTTGLRNFGGSINNDGLIDITNGVLTNESTSNINNQRIICGGTVNNSGTITGNPIESMCHLGTLQINKLTTNGDKRFDFVVTGPHGLTPSVGTFGGTGTFGPTTIPAGTYAIQESVPSGWTLTTASCTDGSSTFSGDTVSGIVINENDNIVCTFENFFSPIAVETDDSFVYVCTSPSSQENKISTIALPSFDVTSPHSIVTVATFSPPQSNIGTGHGCIDMAQDTSVLPSEVWYMIYRSVSDAAVNHLITVNMDTGVGVDLGQIDVGMQSMAFDKYGELYSHTNQNAPDPYEIYHLDKTDGSTIETCDIGKDNGNGSHYMLGYDYTNEKLYVLIGDDSEFYEITDTSLADCGVQSPIVLTGGTSGAIRSLSWNTITETFYGIIHGGQTAIVSVDPVSGIGTDVVTDLDDDLPNDQKGIGFTLSISPPNLDTDNDGIENDVDVTPTVFSNDFSDEMIGGTTFGEIINRGDQILTISEEPNPDGIRITTGPGTGADAEISVCGESAEFFIGDSSEVRGTCGSVILEILQGEIQTILTAEDGTTAEVSLDTGDEFFFDDELFVLESIVGTAEVILTGDDGTVAEVSIPENNSITFEPETSSIITPPENTEPIPVVIDGEETTIEPDESIIVGTPLTQKFLVITTLTSLKDSTDDKLDKKIDKVIKHITKSTDDKFWSDDGQSLDDKKSKKVFDEEKKAVKGLMNIVKKGDSGIDTEISDIITILVDVDRELSQDAINDAKVFEGDKKVDKEIGKAEKELAKGDKEASKGKFDKAIDKYKKAWEHAQKAIKHATK